MARTPTRVMERILGGVGLLTFFGLLGRFGWIFDLAQQFLVQYLAIFLFLVVYFMLAKKRFWALLALVWVLLIAFELIPFISFHIPKAPSIEKPLKILLLNVSSENSEFDRTIAYIKKTDPDLFGLIEINDRWVKALQMQLPAYQGFEVSPSIGSFGIGLFSKIPLHQARIRFIEITGIPSIAAEIQFQGKPIHILLTHPYPPVTPELFGLRNRQFELIAQHQMEFGKNWILMGDLNAAPWSYYLKRLKKETDLHDSRLGFGLQASWPADWVVMRIPIDHLLLSATLRVQKRKVGPNLGSDHLPVVVEVNSL